MKTITRLSLFVLMVTTFSSCFSMQNVYESVSVDQADIHSKVDSISTNTNDSGLSTYECIKDLKQRELKLNSKQRTLSSSELDQYLSIMGVESLCIPSTLGTPFINADWDAGNLTADNGRMISLGFENIYNGSGWSEGFILYSTYDFSAGTEYDIFAEPADYESIQQDLIENQLVVDDTYGFVRFMRSSYCFGQCTAYKVYVFPFKSHYIAVAYTLGAYEYDSDWETIFNTFEKGDFPSQKKADLSAIEFLVSSMEFSSSVR